MDDALLPIWNAFLEGLVTLLVTLILGLTTLGVRRLDLWLAAKLSLEQKRLVDTLLETVVRGVAQEMGEAGNQAKLARALQAAEEALAARKIYISSSTLRNWVESAYRRWKDDQAWAEGLGPSAAVLVPAGDTGAG